MAPTMEDLKDFKAQYAVLFNDPDNLEDPAKIMYPADYFIKQAMIGELPPVSVFLQLRLDEEAWNEVNEGTGFEHDEEKWKMQFTAPNIEPLTEEEAMEYLVIKDLPTKVWSKKHNRPMFKIIRKSEISADRTFRNAWEMTEEEYEHN